MTVKQGNQATTSIEMYKGQKAVIKQVKHESIPIIRNLEFWMLNREARFLKRLDDVPQVPGFLGYPDAYSFAMEFREGKTLREVEPETLPASFYREIERTVEELHQRNVVHSDLKKRENIMVTPEQKPVLIDFGAGFEKKSWYRPFNNFLFEQFREIDCNAVSKLKSRFCPDILTEEDEHRLSQPNLFEKISRWGRKWILFR
ncbi:MAG: RIO1 family regulatory kinase/ATPase [bacterium]